MRAGADAMECGAEGRFRGVERVAGVAAEEVEAGDGSGEGFAGGECVDGVAGVAQPVAELLCEPIVVVGECGAEVVLMRGDEFGGGGGGCGADIGDEIADCDIHLVPDGADDRDAAGGDGAGDVFLIEGPEIFERAAAASDDEDVERSEALGLEIALADCGRDFRAGARALNGDGRDDDFERGEAARECLQDVADGGAAWAGDEANAGGDAGEWAFARGVEESFGLEFGATLAECEFERADAAWFE